MAQESPLPDRTTQNGERFGSAAPEDLPAVLPENDFTRWLNRKRVRVYGWLDGGFTYSSAGSGPLAIGPTPNRFGDQFDFNAAWLIIERRPTQEGWNWGFRCDFFAGSDAALLRPLNSFGPQGTRLGTDFRQLYLSVHMPLLSKGGVDLQVGRQNVPIGYESVMAPYRTFYSNTYFWLSYQVGSTAAIATWHAAKQLELLGGVVLGYNTIFELRGRGPSYVAKTTYFVGREQQTTLIAAVYSGPEPVPVAKGHLGSWQTVADFEVRHSWSERLTQIFQANFYWDANDPSLTRTSSAQGASTTAIFHVNKGLDLDARGELFRDEHGARTGIPGTYGETTIGLNLMPVSWMNLRPEVRADFATQPSYGTVGSANHKRNQLTAACDFLIKF
jgi:Putative beta-barrel porin-2, OmpL-like. bbp2